MTRRCTRDNCFPNACIHAHTSSGLQLASAAWYARELLTSLYARAIEESSRGSSMTITFLAADGVGALGLDDEARSIQEEIWAAEYRDAVTLRTHWAVRPEDLQSILLRDRPTVVHFSGHGDGTEGIALRSTNEFEESHVGAEPLTDLFRVLKGRVRVVVLNACYTKVQADAIVREVDFVVGMSESIGDGAARTFAVAFYRGLASGCSLQMAFDLGINALHISGQSQETSVPKLLVRAGIDAANTTLVSLPASRRALKLITRVRF